MCSWLQEAGGKQLSSPIPSACLPASARHPWLKEPRWHQTCLAVSPLHHPTLRSYAQHAGDKLAPPLGGPDRLAAWPALVPTDVQVQGDSWKGSSTDVAIAGGWSAWGWMARVWWSWL